LVGQGVVVFLDSCPHTTGITVRITPESLSGWHRFAVRITQESASSYHQNWCPDKIRALSGYFRNRCPHISGMLSASFRNYCPHAAGICTRPGSGLLWSILVKRGSYSLPCL
jgi:hypothetical protein